MKNKSAVACLAVVAAFMVAPAAKADQPTQTTTSLDLTNTCTGDVVAGTLSGNIQTVGTATHISVHANLSGSATGTPSGATYAVTAIINEVANGSAVSGPGAGEVTVTAMIRMVGGGSTADIKVLEHITINADGTVTVQNINNATEAATCH